MRPFTFSKRESEFREIICFHCQQAVEKYLKALLVRRQTEFQKTHDIRKLLGYVQSTDPSVAAALLGADALTPFGVEARYPGESPDVLPGGEIDAVQLGREVGTAVMALLEPFLYREEPPPPPENTESA